MTTELSTEKKYAYLTFVLLLIHIVIGVYFDISYNCAINIFLLIVALYSFYSCNNALASMIIFEVSILRELLEVLFVSTEDIHWNILTASFVISVFIMIINRKIGIILYSVCCLANCALVMTNTSFFYLNEKHKLFIFFNILMKAVVIYLLSKCMDLKADEKYL